MKKIKKIEDNLIKDVRNTFRLKKEIGDTTTRCKKSFRLKKEKDNTTVKDIRNLVKLKKRK